MIPLGEAQRFVFGLCHSLPPVELPLDDALGSVLSAIVVATEQVPSFANSAMDGYAVRADDTAGAPVRLTVIGSSDVNCIRVPLSASLAATSLSATSSPVREPCSLPRTWVFWPIRVREV